MRSEDLTTVVFFLGLIATLKGHEVFRSSECDDNNMKAKEKENSVKTGTQVFLRGSSSLSFHIPAARLSM
jgi:hypothetical protein